MLSIVKTAIITIIISFISGVLLDYYKNFGSKIVCSLKKVKLKNGIESNCKVYVVDIKNISNKIIHDLNLNIQASCSKIRIEKAQITKGLKFDIEDNRMFYDVSIPFLSKDDEFKAFIYLEDTKNDNVKPILALRSPEKFKKVYKFNNKQIESNNDEVNKKTSLLGNFNKKKIIAAFLLFIVVFGVVSIGEHMINKISNLSDVLPKSDDSQKNTTDTSSVQTDTQTNQKTNTTDKNISKENEQKSDTQNNQSSASQNSDKKATENIQKDTDSESSDKKVEENESQSINANSNTVQNVEKSKDATESQSNDVKEK
ncbi:hypothetical protein [Clostridium sp. BJN0001]|uniref:hypothetical protein n=1 Tax=Clostridium sp. BJN0001 TaxID=2930219 RepID=UPI001FD0EB6C|nr:hypothetical protein [Clostridium sp. BJN0001]